MSKVKWLGDTSNPEGGKTEINFYGVMFKQGEAKNLNLTPWALAKIKGHPQFEVDDQPFERATARHDVNMLEVGATEQSEDGESEERSYTVEELTALLNTNKVKVPSAIKDDANMLMQLVADKGIELPE